MMDRNLGATSATPGDDGSYGLLYQWGRKDPFLGRGRHNPHVRAVSTGNWAVNCTDNINNSLSIPNPTTFYTKYYNVNEYTWHSKKTAYDPCPVGWRVPDGGENGIWEIAGFADNKVSSVDDAGGGVSFVICSPESTWYPFAGCITDGKYSSTDALHYSSVTTGPYGVYALFGNAGNFVGTSLSPSCGLSVRCQKE